MMFTQYEKDLAAWKKTRAEYAALVAAVAAGRPNAELTELAADAGIAMGAAVELRNLHHRATSANMIERAAKFDKTQRELDALDAKIAELDKAMALAKTPLQSDELEGQLYAVADKRQRLGYALADCQSAKSCVDAAREAGLV